VIKIKLGHGLSISIIIVPDFLEEKMGVNTGRSGGGGGEFQGVIRSWFYLLVGAMPGALLLVLFPNCDKPFEVSHFLVKIAATFVSRKSEINLNVTERNGRWWGVTHHVTRKQLFSTSL
jgi:hypothetical protein